MNHQELIKTIYLGDRATKSILFDGRSRLIRIQESYPRNPNSWQSDKGVDLQGKTHFDKATMQEIPTPHVHEQGGRVRPANPNEIP